MVRFAHISDTHLGFRQYNLEDREEDFYESFREAVDSIIEERVDFVIHTGDLFEHNRPKIKAILEAQRALFKFRDKNIPFYAIAGNHDIVLRRGAIPPQVLLEFFGLKLLGHKVKYITIPDKDIFIAGLPYYPRFYSDALKQELINLSERASNHRIKILMLHQGLDTYLPYERSFELRLTELPTNFNYYALGHVHRRIIERYGDGILAFPGSIDIWRLDEVEDFQKKGKGYNLVELDGDEPEIQHISLKSTRRFDSYVLKTKKFDDELKKLKEKVMKLAQESKKKPIVGIRIKGTTEFDKAFYIKRIMDAIGDFVLKFRANFELEFEEYKDTTKQLIAVVDILNDIFKGNKVLVDFTKTMYDLLKEGETADAIAFAEEFYKTRWKDDIKGVKD